MIWRLAVDMHMDPDVLMRKPASRVLEWLTFSAARAIAAEAAQDEAQWRAGRSS